jgi:AcrR family transcriptional regulator
MAIQPSERVVGKSSGRPRSPEIHQEILTAAEQLLLEGGYAALSIEAVALRAGVAKTTVYRRWPSRLAIVSEVLSDANKRWPMPAPQGGSAYDDLIILYRNWVAGMSGAGRVIPSLIAESIQNPKLAELLHAKFVRPRRALAIGIIESAVDRGELAKWTDAETAIDMFMGRMWYRLLVTGAAVRSDDGPRVVTLLLDGLRHAERSRATPRRQGAR